MFNRFRTSNLVKKTETKSILINKSQKLNDEYLVSGVYAGLLGVIFGSTLLLDKKEHLSNKEKIYWNTTLSITVGSTAFSIISLIKYFKK